MMKDEPCSSGENEKSAEAHCIVWDIHTHEDTCPHFVLLECALCSFGTSVTWLSLAQILQVQSTEVNHPHDTLECTAFDCKFINPYSEGADAVKYSSLRTPFLFLPGHELVTSSFLCTSLLCSTTRCRASSDIVFPLCWGAKIVFLHTL